MEKHLLRKKKGLTPFSTILVTGGAGFIGSEFVRQSIVRGYKVIVLDKLTYAGDLKRLEPVKNKIKFYKADVSDKKLVLKIFSAEKPQIVVHFAAESHVDRSILNADPFMQSNVLGTHIMLDAAMKSGVKTFVNVSTDEVYGELGKKGEFFETTPLMPNSPYSVSKASADMLGRAYFRTHGLPVITIRASNNYGPWQYPEKLIPVVIYNALNDKPIPVYAKGENVREWLFVSECVDAVFFVMVKGSPGEIYNIGSGFEKKNLDVVKSILKILNKPESLISFVKDRPGHDFRYSLNTHKIKKETGWKAHIDFAQGIEKTVKWYLSNRDWMEEKVQFLKDYWKQVYS